MIRTKRGLITVGILVFVLGVVILFPARVAIGWFAPSNLLMSGVQGTAWNGRAAEFSADGLYLKDITWSANPLKLFTGNLSYDIAAKPVSGFLESEVQVSAGGTLSLHDLRAALPLRVFAALAGVSGLQGNSSLNFERVVIVDGLATAADGTVQVADLVIPDIARTSLGGYEAEFSTLNDGIVASIEDSDGAVDLAGSLQVHGDRSYEFIAQVMIKSSTPSNIQQMLKLMPANERGQYELRLEGSL